MATQPTRRHLLTSVAVGGPSILAGGAVETKPLEAEVSLRPGSIPVAELPSQFDVEPGVHNLEAGYWSMMPRVVAQTYARHNAAVNSANAEVGRRWRGRCWQGNSRP